MGLDDNDNYLNLMVNYKVKNKEAVNYGLYSK